MSERLAPATPEDVVEAVRWAAGNSAPLAIAGAGTKRGWGRAVRTNLVLDMSMLSGVTLYEPDELVLSAGPGTPLVEIQTLLAEHNQQLAFEPPDLGPLFGQPAGMQTLGGVIATNLSGARRIKAGGARDHFLGFSAVTGRGESIKSGGRVVKNVTGYDLCKLFAGSFGTLGVMTSLTVKVLPAGDKTRTVLLYGLDDGFAVRALTHALNSSHEVSGAAHLPAAVAARSQVGYVRDPGTSVTAVRVEGIGPSVEHRCAALREMLAGYGEDEELHGHNSRALWREVGDVAPLLSDPDQAIWRLSVPPAVGPSIAHACDSLPGAAWYFDWGGGLIWLACNVGADAGATLVRTTLGQDHTGGHATLMRAPDAVRDRVPPFPPQAEAVAALSRRLRENFDPSGILNPGRMG